MGEVCCLDAALCGRDGECLGGEVCGLDAALCGRDADCFVVAGSSPACGGDGSCLSSREGAEADGLSRTDCMRRERRGRGEKFGHKCVVTRAVVGQLWYRIRCLRLDRPAACIP